MQRGSVTTFSYRIDSIVTDRTLKNIGTFSSYEEFLTNGILFFAKTLKKKFMVFIIKSLQLFNNRILLL